MAIQIKTEVGDSSEEEDYFEETRKKTIKAKGRLVSNHLGIKADFSVLLDRPRKDILSIASKYGEKPLLRPLLGLGPAGMKQGDIFADLYGCSVSVVLRPVQHDEGSNASSYVDDSTTIEELP
jgi:hypothetical protein